MSTGKVSLFRMFSRFLSLGLVWAVVSVICFARVAPSAANPVDLFGAGAVSGGSGDAVTATCVGAECLYFNPGFLSLDSGPRLMIGVTGQFSSFSTPQGTVSINDPFYSHVGASVLPPFSGFLKDRLWFGIYIAAPSREISWVRMHTPSEPFYPYYENRSQRLMIIPGLSCKILDSPVLGQWALGLGVNYFAGFDGGMVGTEGATRAMEARVAFELKGLFGLNAGLAWRRGPWSAGITYRQAFGVDFHTVAFNHVAGTDIDMEITSQALYSPHTFQWGGAYRAGATTFSLDVVEQLWSYWNGPYVDLRSQMPMVGELSGVIPYNRFRNTLGFRAGLVHRHSDALTFRGGLGFDPSFVVTAQTGITNLLDAHKLTFSGGVSWNLSRSLTLHAFGRLQFLLPVTHRKKTTEITCSAEVPDESSDHLLDEWPCDPDDPTTGGFQTSNPGYPSVTASGFVFMTGLTLEVLP